ncbi:DmpA/ArgJ-like protein [Mollisia scopiformis]|uniref:DmpA/ArgJ-like protein n=1 Tax=Mollisia scopiformis TaxID=149040 RepID=A0A194XAH8_MOLSC|nr:DmpA/ArgJ-like protein [Mollisia scopiformis]KUJ17178.1 DmpA/ArgJ-like protein [Mollisia scopiformis]
MARITTRDLGYSPGQLEAGPKNSILDIKGVHVGQVTVGKDGDDVCNGVTIILPRDPSEIHIPCYAGMHTLNGNGEVTGSYQVKDWGYTSSPLALTNSCSLGITFHAIWQWTLAQARKNGTSSEALNHNYATPVVGETSDWWLNDAHQTALEEKHIHEAFANALTQTEVQEGQRGGGAGMTCHFFPGGTGTSSRIVRGHGEKKYTVGVICQSNYGHLPDLQIGGVPIGKLIFKERGSPVHQPEKTQAQLTSGGGKADEGSIVIYLITDAPVLPHQLNRMARHCAVGLAQVGGHGVGRNHSGDIIMCLSTANKPDERVSTPQVNMIGPIEKNQIEIIKNESIDAMFRAASEATEEAILNSIIAGRDGRTGFEGIHFDGFPVDFVKELLKMYRVDV